MKRVVSTKVDEATYAEFLEYCAKNNKYPANAMREALELLLNSERIHTGAQKSPEPKQMTVQSRQAKTEQEIDEDEEELFG